MINISKQEAKFLIENGVLYGEDGVSATSSRHSGKQYRVCESKRNVFLLKEYAKSHICEK